MWWEQIAPRSRVQVPISKLSFDTNNPRFTPEKRPASDDDAGIISHLAATADLGELIQSISASGYVDIEPLIAIGRGDELVVLEGNRRLAALKALTSPTMATAAKMSIPKVSVDHAATLKEASVYRVENEEEARDLIGFKHINGPKVWDAYAKARYAAAWLDTERQKRETTGSGLNIVEIAHRMGDKHDTIFRIVSAAYLLQQAEEAGVFRVDDRATRQFSFSHLYTAITYPEYRDFIGMKAPNRGEDPEQRPVPDRMLPHLGQLLRWLYGSKSEAIEPAIKRQNPDLARLKRVLGDPKSRLIMMERHNLNEAITSTLSPDTRFEKYIVDADQNLQDAQSAIDGYDGSDETLLEIGKGVFQKSRSVLRSMEAARTDFLKDEDDSGS